MNILYLDWPCFGHVDVCFTLEHEMNHSITKFFHEDYKERESEGFLQAFDTVFQSKPFDCCFSYNYYPLLAEAAHRHDLKYISLVYDSPFVKLYSYTIAYPTNYVFLFDYELYRELRDGGVPTVYYSSLPVNSTVIDVMLRKPYDKERTSCEVSFVGALYNEDHNLFDRVYEKINPYTQGYLDAIMQAQLKISGYNFIEELLDPPIVDELYRVEPYQPPHDGVETLANVYANYYIDRKLTSMERIQLLRAVSEQFPLKLFTLDEKATIPGAVNMGITDYYEEMPLVFHNSKINLNITLRSIKSGIPLRCMDILGAGGFLLTNYQADLFRHFNADEDFVYYEDEADLLRKIDYYLSHDDERTQIAKSGHRKALQNHNYKKILTELFTIAKVI